MKITVINSSPIQLPKILKPNYKEYINRNEKIPPTKQ
jgi:hypothetical protein